MVQSVGRTGVCWDNSVAESAWSSLKRELVHRYRFATRAEARRAIFAWINRDDQAVPFVGVARREADLEVGHGRSCESGCVELLDSPDDRWGAQSGQNARVEQGHQRQAAERSSRSASASTDSALAS